MWLFWEGYIDGKEREAENMVVKAAPEEYDSILESDEDLSLPTEGFSDDTRVPEKVILLTR